MAKIEILNPVAQVRVRNSSLSPRPATLDNSRIGLYWNGKPGGDTALAYLGQLMETKYRGVQLELIRSGTNGAKEHVEYAMTFDGVIGGCAD